MEFRTISYHFIMYSIWVTHDHRPQLLWLDKKLWGTNLDPPNFDGKGGCDPKEMEVGAYAHDYW